MTNVKELTIEQLQAIIAEAQNEIAAREAQGKGFHAEFIKGSKSYKEASKKQVNYIWDLAKQTDSVIECSSSALYTKFTPDVISEMIDLMRDGKRIKIS